MKPIEQEIEQIEIQNEENIELVAKPTKIKTWPLFKESGKILWEYSKNSKLLIFLVILCAIGASILSLYTLYITGTFLNDVFIALIKNRTDEVLQKFVLTLVLFFSFYLIQMSFNLIQSLILVRISQNVGFDIRRDLFNKLQKVSVSYLDTQSTGNLMSCFTNDVDVVIITFSQSVNQIVNAMFMLVGAIIMLFLINPLLAVISISIAVVLFMFVSIFIKKSQPFFLEQQKILGLVTSDVEEYNFAHKMSILFGSQDNVISSFAKNIKHLRHNSIRAQVISGLIFPYNNFINNIIVTIITTIIIVLMCFQPNLATLGVFRFDVVTIVSLYLLLLRQTTTQISTILSQLNQFQLAFAALKRVKDVLIIPNESTQNRTTDIVIDRGEIKFENVSFSYIKDKPVLHDINFTALSNTMNAIVGPTGSGKTTIISLLSAYYDLDSGRILIDNQDINKFSKSSVRDDVSIVLQDSFLFSTSIMENIRYGRLDASDEDVIKAAEISNANKFIEKLPAGYQTLVSNETELLSEGEKQLISIARAFLSNAKIIVLDEATSYVDTKTEKDIQAGMQKLMKSRTSIVIAHRLSTIKDADNIVVIKEGHQIESGNHEALMKNKNYYYELNTAMDQDFDDLSDK